MYNDESKRRVRPTHHFFPETRRTNVSRLVQREKRCVGRTLQPVIFLELEI
jgi:hypothetical protein